MDLPDDWGPITQTTTTLSFFEDSMTPLMNSPLNSKFSPSISSKQSPFFNKISILFEILYFIFYFLYLTQFDSYSKNYIKHLQKYSIVNAF